VYRVLGADQKEYGPVSEEQIRQWIAERRLNAQSLVMGEGAVAWKPLSTYPEFASLLSPQIPATAAQPNVPPTAPSFGQGPQTTNTFALVGMIMGIISLLSSCCCSGLPFNVLGLVFSILGLNQIKSRHPAEKGKEMAIAGIILSALSLILGVVIFILGRAMDLPDVLKQMKGKF
jgi:Domain of unknown function (DUF4190)/GYF domain 2